MLTGRIRRDEGGFSLVEALIAFILLGAVGAMMSTSITGGLRTTRTVQDQVGASANLRTAVERVARELRTADPVETGTAGPTKVQVRIVRNGVCSRFIYRLVGTNLMQYVQKPLTPAPAAVGVRTVRNACITPAATEPPPSSLAGTVAAKELVPGGTVFQYYDVDGNEMVFGGPGVLLEKNIARIRLTLHRQLAGKKPVRVTTDVHLRNGDAIRAVEPS